MKTPRWQWRLLSIFCGVGWLLAIAYVVADLRDQSLDLF